MLKRFIYLFSSIILSIAVAYYQRVTGPTYPVKGSLDKKSKYYLPRSCTRNEGRCKVYIKNPEIDFYVMYKRYGVEEEFSKINSSRDKDESYLLLPDVVPPGGKIEYDVYIKDDGVVRLNKERVIVRFKDKVDTPILILHIVVMFLSLGVIFYLTFMIVFEGKYNPTIFWLGYLLFFAGGFVLGPLLQKQAFGIWWSGFPFGYDMTDNKTLVVFLFWTIAAFKVLFKKDAKGMIVLSSLITLISYLIPHSIFGTEYSWEFKRLK